MLVWYLKAEAWSHDSRINKTILLRVQRTYLHIKDVYKKDGPGPLMVSDTLCPAVHILGTWAVFFKILKFRQGSGPEWDNVL